MSHAVLALEELDEIAEAVTVFGTAMVAFAFPTDDVGARHEPGRTLVVRDGDDVVGAAASYTSWLTAPGGERVPHAAVTHVGVLPTHTRRGVVSGLLRRQLEDVAERGEVVASLRASEGGIYERFGYGIASHAATFVLDRRRGRLRDTVPRGGPVRLVDAATAEELRPLIYSRAAWTGAIARPSYWWASMRRWLTDTPARHVAVHGAPGDEDGFVVYRAVDVPEWWHSRDRTVVVEDFVAHTDAAYAGLVRHLAELDPVDTVRFEARPVDDPLAALFADPRAVRRLEVRDEAWLRLVDVGAALAARTYGSGAPVVVDVADALLPANAGRYRVDAGGAAPTDAPADLSVDVAGLASVYLGDARWSALARAGRVQEHAPGAAAAADVLFATVDAPFAGTQF